MKKVYVASPYTIGDVAINVKRHLDAGDVLIDYGYAPFLPLLSHFQHMIRPRHHSEWLSIDLEWIKSCDYLIRLEGESKGADKEVEFAKSLGVPVFYGLSDFIISMNDVDVRP